MQNGLPFRRGSATHLPRVSRMLLDEVIEHRCPDFVVPWQRAEDADTSMAESKTGAELRNMLQYIREMVTERANTSKHNIALPQSHVWRPGAKTTPPGTRKPHV